jgi:hypothetical protein
MTWLTSLNPTLAAAVVSAVVSLIVAMITALLAPTVKYGFDRRLERRKLELAYAAEQSKALRDRIGFHKGTILSTAEELAGRILNFQETPKAPEWLKGQKGYYVRTFAFRILAHWWATDRFYREAIYIDAEVATRRDWAFAKAVKLNLDVWSQAELFNGLGYSGDRASDHFFRGQITSIVESFSLPGSDRARSWAEFEQALEEHLHDFGHVFIYLNRLRRMTSDLKYQRLMASYWVLVATLNSFGYDYQRKSMDRVSEISSQCGPEVRSNLRGMILELSLEREPGFRELMTALADRSQESGLL